MISAILFCYSIVFGVLWAHWPSGEPGSLTRRLRAEFTLCGMVCFLGAFVTAPTSSP